MDIDQITFSSFPFVCGLLVVIAFGGPVKAVLDGLTDHLKESGGQNHWITLRMQGNAIGYFERILFYFSIIFGYPTFIGAWLVFKVAAKWNAWSHIVKLPELDTDDLNSQTFETRYRFSSWLLSRFMLGTLLNIFVVVVAVFIYLIVQIWATAT